jgi:membrane-bound lytic murein transglycosylase D
MDTLNIDRLLQKYQKRGLPVFKHPDLYREIEERLIDENKTQVILAGRFVKYRDVIEEERRKQQLSWFVSYIPLANTGMEPRFRNSAGYAGMWPLPYLMAKKYGLVQTALYDERHEIKQSSRAACLFLNELQHIYQDWLLTITAFSIGPARLNQVLHATKSLDFDSVYDRLHAEEKIPIVQFIATAVVLSEMMENQTSFPGSVNIELVKVSSIPRIIPFEIFHEYFDIGIAQMRQYNPGLRADIIPYMGNIFEFNLPKAKAEHYLKSKDSIAFWLKGTPEIEITYDTLIKVFGEDTVTIIETPLQVDVPQLITERKPDLVWIYYTVKRGDALYTLTDIFDCSAEDIRRWNPSKFKNYLIVGNRLKIQVPSSKRTYYQEIESLTLIQKRERAKSDD